MFTKYIKYRFSIAQLIQPVQNPYWTSYGTEMIVSKSEVLDNLLKTAISILTQDNTDIIKQYKKDLKLTKEIKHNIEFANDIEWGLLEHLLQLRTQLDNKKFQLIFEQNQSLKPQWKQIGQLEVYGISPYRHQNHYIHEYNHKAENERVTFEVKPQVEQQSNIEKNSEKLAKPILDTLEKEKQDVAGFFGRAKNFVKKVNKLVINEDILKEEETKTSWKKYIIEPSKNNRILVRDYEYEFEGIMTVKDENNQYLNNTQFTNSIQPKLNKIYLRTEAWMEAKESLSTMKGKRQVLTDFNCLLRGNPWVWVKKFDEEEN